jgi:hypothetical protein
MSGIIKLFDIQNGVVVPTEHCYIIKCLKDIMLQRPDDYLKYYAFLFYMHCPNPDLNPFFNWPEDEKEEGILKHIDADFSSEDDLLLEAMPFVQKCYVTTLARGYTNFKIAYDKMGKYLATTPIEHGRDGNVTAMLSAMKNYDDIRVSFMSTEKALKEEQAALVRGGQRLAYDQ